MIVSMKKVSLVVLDSQREASLEALRDVGVMHLDLQPEQGERFHDLLGKKDLLERAIGALPDRDGKAPAPVDGPVDLDAALAIAKEVDAASQREFCCHEEIALYRREIDRLSAWGDFDPRDIAALKEKGVDIRLCEISKAQLSEMPAGIQPFIISESKTGYRIAAVIRDASVAFPFEETHLPQDRLSEIPGLIDIKTAEADRHAAEVHSHYANKPMLQRALAQVDELLGFDAAVTSMKKDGPIAYITGFIPVKKADALSAAAAKHGWGLIIADPADGEVVPTLVENPWWIRAINPVFSLLGTIPGYKEFDISIWFLLFFTIFWAMIIGDAAYGLLFLLFTIVGRIVFRKAPFEPFLLLFITSIATIIWGAITGTWFGAEAVARHSAFSWMVVPEIASFASMAKGQTDVFVMHVCFLIGCVHLTIAHVMCFIRQFPSLKAYAEVGRLSLLWGLYFLVRMLVLKMELNPVAIYMVGGGLLFILVFAEQEGKFFAGMIKGFSNILMVLLGSVGFFSDIVSYVRLFAVGLASLEVAKSFNGMATGSLTSGNVLLIVLGVVVLFFGHALNIILSCMSLVVHGVRLNMLEFSGHLGMEWTGVEYRPFKRNSSDSNSI
ncbi:MAG TPA: V-type ATP synthase subunit I [Spirochaetota bacterium]|nr:V-type ATP synthase subunit I [Spirochaetota bacterium]HNT12058.1 V-type ATP synthase subunit I [Spirochaetota bacterium]